MSSQRRGPRSSNFFVEIGRALLRWFANVLGISFVAGGVGTAAGLFMGWPFYVSLGLGAVAIVLMLALYLFMMSGGDL